MSGDVEASRDILFLYPEIDIDDLLSPIRFRPKRHVATLSAVVTILQQMVPEVRAEYSQVCQLVQLLLVSPASSATAERSFSALRRLNI